MESTIFKREFASLSICTTRPNGCSAHNTGSRSFKAEHPPAKSGFYSCSSTAQAGKNTIIIKFLKLQAKHKYFFI